MEKTIVELNDRSYPIYLGNDSLNNFPSAYRSSHLPLRAAIITDANVASLYLKKFSAILRKSEIETVHIVIAPGERQKSLAQATRLYTHLLRHRFTRRDGLIALGGGVVG